MPLGTVAPAVGDSSFFPVLSSCAALLERNLYFLPKQGNLKTGKNDRFLLEETLTFGLYSLNSDGYRGVHPNQDKCVLPGSANTAKPGTGCLIRRLIRQNRGLKADTPSRHHLMIPVPEKSSSIATLCAELCDFCDFKQPPQRKLQNELPVSTVCMRKEAPGP